MHDDQVASLEKPTQLMDFQNTLVCWFLKTAEVCVDIETFDLKSTDPKGEREREGKRES